MNKIDKKVRKYIKRAQIAGGKYSTWNNADVIEIAKMIQIEEVLNSEILFIAQEHDNPQCPYKIIIQRKKFQPGCKSLV